MLNFIFKILLSTLVFFLIINLKSRALKVIILVILLVLLFISICALFGYISSDYDYDSDIYPKENEVNVIHYYHPIEPYEIIDGLLPDDIDSLDEFNRDACYIAQTLWGECRGLNKYEQSLVAWCILNRVDDGRMGTNVYDVVSRPNQFLGFNPANPIDSPLYELSADVMMRWLYEKYCIGDVGRTLPKEYLFFVGKDGHNWFRKEYSDKDVFDFTTNNPYRRDE